MATRPRNPATIADVSPQRGFGGPKRRAALGIDEIDPNQKRERQGGATPQRFLDAVALASAPIPVAGDIIGGAADIVELYKNPSLLNAGFLAAGLIPGVPSGVVARKIGDFEEIFQGKNVGNKGTAFFSNDPEFARQFTQSGLDKEITRAQIKTKDIMDATDVFAGEMDTVDDLIKVAKSRGKKAIRLSEGKNQPPSVFVFDRSALKSQKQFDGQFVPTQGLE